jgi:hypothetical protein
VTTPARPSPGWRHWAPSWAHSAGRPARPAARLHARNPEPGAAALPEQVYAHPLADSIWTYWWPWVQPIAADPTDAAQAITRVLRTATTRPDS